MRLSATKAVMERRDVVIVATVSAIYGLGDPKSYLQMVLHLDVGDEIDQRIILRRLAELQYSRNDSIFSIGARKEKVEYAHDPVSGPKMLTGEYDLSAYDIGVNTSLNNNTSIFTNYNQAFQAPLIDRFFISATWPATGQVFNGFVKPSKSKNFNLGLNHLTDKSKTKLTSQEVVQ